jgi:drug/metabolite transporter (DMT)-like permease
MIQMKETAKKRPAYTPYASLVAGIISLSMSAIFVRWAQAPGVISSFYRMGIASIIMVIPFVIQFRNKKVSLPSRGVLFAFLGGFAFSLDMVFWSTGVVMSGASIPTLLANTTPIWVGLGSWLLLKEKRRGVFWLGLLITVGGASMILVYDMNQSAELGLGGFFGILAAVFYSGFHLASQRGREYLDTLSYFWISTTVSAAFLFIYALILGEPLVGYDQNTWVSFIGMGVLIQVLGWMLINYTQGHLPAAIVSPSMMAQPILAALFAVVLLNEKLTGWHMLGGLFVIGGIFLVYRNRMSIR